MVVDVSVCVVKVRHTAETIVRLLPQMRLFSIVPFPQLN